jgi:hypothetical protein
MNALMPYIIFLLFIFYIIQIVLAFAFAFEAQDTITKKKVLFMLIPYVWFFGLIKWFIKLDWE